MWVPVSVGNQGLLVPPKSEDLGESGNLEAPFFADLGQAALTQVTGRWE